LPNASNLNEAAGLTRILTANRVMMGTCRIHLCAFDAGLADVRRGLEIARRIGNRHGEMFSLFTIAGCMTQAGRHKEAADILAQALEQARALNARRYEAFILAFARSLRSGKATAARLLRSFARAWQRRERRVPDLWGRFFMVSLG
jgi:hypothetical protein